VEKGGGSHYLLNHKRVSALSFTLEHFMCTHNKIDPTLILFEQSNCIDWILFLLYTINAQDIAAFLIHVDQR